MARSFLSFVGVGAFLAGAIVQGCAGTADQVVETAAVAEVEEVASEATPAVNMEGCDGFALPAPPTPPAERPPVEWTGDVTTDQVCSSRIAVSLVPGDEEALVVPQAPKGHSGTIRAEVTWLMRMLTQATPRLVATLENPKIASIPGGQVKLDVDVSVAEQSSWTGRAASWGGQLERHLTDLTKASLAEDLAVDAGWVCMDLTGLGGDLGLPAGSLAMKPLKIRVERSVLDGLEITAPVQNLDAVVILEDAKGRTLEKQSDSFPGRVTVGAGQCGCDQFVRVRPRKEDSYKRHVAFGPKAGTEWAEAQGLRVVFGVPGGGIPTFVETSEVPSLAKAEDASAAYTRLVKSVYTSPITAVMPRVGYDKKSLTVSLKRGAIATSLSGDAREALEAVKGLNEGVEPLDNVCLRGGSGEVLASFGLAKKERGSFYAALDGAAGVTPSVVVDLAKTGLSTGGFAMIDVKGTGADGAASEAGDVMDALLKEMRAERAQAMTASLPDKSLLERTGYVRLPLARREGLAEGLQFLDIKAYLSGAVTLEASDVIRMDHAGFVAEVPLAAIMPRDAIDQVVKSLTTPWGMLQDKKVSVDVFNVMWSAVEVPYGPKAESMAVLALDYAGNVLAKGEGQLSYGVRVERSDRAQCTIDIMDRGDVSDAVNFTFLGPARPELVKKFEVVNQGTHFIQERFRANKKCTARAGDDSNGELVACTAP